MKKGFKVLGIAFILLGFVFFAAPVKSEAYWSVSVGASFGGGGYYPSYYQPYVAPISIYQPYSYYTPTYYNMYTPTYIPTYTNYYTPYYNYSATPIYSYYGYNGYRTY